MRRTKKVHLARVVLLAAVVLGSTWGVGTSASDAAPSRAEAPAAPAAPSQAAEQTSTIRYGPYTIQPGPVGPDGMRESHVSNQFAFLIQKPCNNCYITSMKADLVNASGQVVGMSNGVSLHHMVLFNTDADRTDATCEWGIPFPLGGLFGQRFFASGDERTLIDFPPSYGYQVDSGSWTLIWDLMSMADTAQTVFYQMTYKYVPGTTAGMRDIEPIWFDIAQCGFSTFSVPVGPSQRSWTWTVNRPGVFTTIGGHGHDGTINIQVRNDSTGEVICDSRAGYGETPMYVSHMGEHLSSMSYCGSGDIYDPAGSAITNGQRITINAFYDQEEAVNDQMGIVMGFVGQPCTGTGCGGTGTTGTTTTGSCVSATNSAHVTAGRATSWLVFAWARGSNNYLGATWATTSLREGPSGTWSMVTSC